MRVQHSQGVQHQHTGLHQTEETQSHLLPFSHMYLGTAELEAYCVECRGMNHAGQGDDSS